MKYKDTLCNGSEPCLCKQVDEHILAREAGLQKYPWQLLRE